MFFYFENWDSLLWIRLIPQIRILHWQCDAIFLLDFDSYLSVCVRFGQMDRAFVSRTLAVRCTGSIGMTAGMGWN